MKLIFFACSLLLFIAGACQTPRPSVCLKGNILLSSFQDYKLYLQDHGEDMLDDDRKRFLHASPHPTYYQLHIPLLFWFSENYREQFPEKYAAAESNQTKIYYFCK